ncbi:site-specific tyrosine recombinase XerD [Nesterenkonia flava]|uniref:Tyrosine recombinase XerD n=1 Tax=Nesterenkonia flava TaxID=469799 RepID=A0ABU1FTM3_9MICC|nr:site-specific tyrosine recombinase XerD [Nesterenkonia flava]MDR5712011.1 site-specific tyrosine recombinase XerD [Nesterenkonia flava]
MSLTSLAGEIGSYLDHLRVERGSSPNTLAAYQRDLRRYEQYLGSRGLTSPAAIETGHIADFLRLLSDGSDGSIPLSERSAARVLASVRGLHRYWAQEGRTTHDPARELSAPKLAQTLPKALTSQQVADLLEAPSPATPLGLRDRALLEFLYATGARISEAVSLDVDDLHDLAGNDSDEEVMLVRVTGKGNKQRMVPLGRYARRAVGDYLTAGRPSLAEAAARGARTARRSSPALFLNKLGGRLSRQSAWTVLQKSAAAAGIETDVSPHTLRHSCATHMLEGGADVRTVQEMLGHASVTTTQIYTKVTAESLWEQYLTAHPRAQHA